MAELRAVFSTVRGPLRARRGDCQEPWTGRDGKMRSTPVLETSGPPSLWRMAGPARYDIYSVWDGRGRQGTAGDCGLLLVTTGD